MNNSLELFGEKIKKYCRLCGKSQKMLAGELGLHPTVLSHKLSNQAGTTYSSNNRILTYAEIKTIIRTLATWQAITTDAEAQELLELSDCQPFTTEEWRTPPLSQLETVACQPLVKSVSLSSNSILKTSANESQDLAKQSALTATNLSEVSVELITNNNLPPRLTSFIGREQQLAECKQFLTAPTKSFNLNRLLTLIGVGGAGKTRMALEIGAELLNVYADGVWFVELASVNDPNSIIQTIADALGITEKASRESTLTTLTRFLYNRQLLLILDNCEHQTEACARIIQNLLSCRKIQVIATSREPLNIPGEITFQVPSLSLPNLSNGPHSLTVHNLFEYEATKLFFERAQIANSRFSVAEENVQVIAEICTRLDGIPLAIELAAARVKILSVEQLNARLDNRFQLLTSGNRTALPRQKTLRALIDWSYDLLNESEKTLFRWLSIFRGSFTLEAVEAVCSDQSEAQAGQDYEILDLLAALVNKSLVVVADEGANLRYRYLETIHEYAQEKLEESGELERLQRSYCVYFTSLAEESSQNALGAQQASWLAQIEREYDNFRAALGWACDKAESGLAIRLSGALGRFWYVRCFLSEGWHWLQRSLPALVTPPPAVTEKQQANMLYWAATLAMTVGKYQQATTLYEQSLVLSRILEDKSSVTAVLNRLGELSRNRGEYSQASHLLEESLILARELGNLDVVANALSNYGEVAWDQGDYERAQGFYRESLEIFRQLEDQIGIAKAFLRLGQVERIYGNFKLAQDYFVQSQNLFKQRLNRWGIASTTHRLGQVAFDQGDYKQANILFEKSLFLFHEQGDRWGVAEQLADLGRVAMLRNEFERAGRLFKESLTMYHKIGVGLQIAALTVAQGELAFYEGDYVKATALVSAGLLNLRELGAKAGIVKALALLGALAEVNEDWEQASTFYQTALELATAINYKSEKANCQKKLNSLSSLLEQGRVVIKFVPVVTNFAGKLITHPAHLEQVAEYSGPLF